MAGEIINEAIRLAKQNGHLLVATADAQGLPHIATAAEVFALDENRVQVRYWFCPHTLSNLSANPKVSLVVWDSRHDRGYQLVGAVEKVEEDAVLDGFAAEELEQPPIPQVERSLIVAVERVLEFKHAPHNDLEIQPYGG